MSIFAQSPKCCGRNFCCCSLDVSCPGTSCCAHVCCNVKKRCFKRNSRFLKDLCILYMFTFLVFVPLLTFFLRHTAFDFLKSRNVTRENTRMLKENAERYKMSLDILKELETKRSDTASIMKRNLLEQSDSNVTHRTLFHDFRPDVKPGVAITIITVSRSADEDHEPHYLTQIVASFLRLINENEYLFQEYDIHFSICDVDAKPTAHTEVEALPKWIPIFSRYQNIGNKSHVTKYGSILNKEKDDYAYCLDQALGRNLSYVLLVEDDALPRDELFLVLDTLVFSRGKRGLKNPQENVAFYKLYHPERLLGYISLEFERIPELLSSSALLSVVLLLIYTRWGKKISTPHIIILLALFIYSCLLFLAIGRVNIIELRRLSRHLYQLTPSPTCCTPAMLFTRNGGRRISDYLKTVITRPRFAKDTAIDEFIRTNGLVTRFIQPNLFQHIGHVSSLRLKLLDPYIV